FDGEAIRTLLAGRPALTVAYGKAHKAVAEKLAADLSARGLKARARPEGEVLRKVDYPRVRNPYATVYSPIGASKKPAGMKVKVRTTLGVGKDGTLTARTADGKDGRADWRLPNSLVTI